MSQKTAVYKKPTWWENYIYTFKPKLKSKWSTICKSAHLRFSQHNICCCSCQSEPRAALDNCSWPWSSDRQRCRYAVSCVAYGVRMFCCVTTAPQHQTLSVRFCVPFAGYASSRLLQRNTRSRLSSVDFSRFSMPSPDWYIDLLGMSTSHQCCETYTGCGLRNASISS